jgi:pyruvate carboxylase subunit B
MLYHVTLGSRTFRVELADGRISIDGEPLGEAELMTVPGTSVHHLLVDGHSRTVVARPGAAAGLWELHVDGFRQLAEVIDERTRRLRSLTRRGDTRSAPRPVRAPMPGMIVRVEVAVSERVQAGQGVVIMEAMKMENELRADTDGVVARILVRPGEPVDKGAVLIEFADMGGHDNG